MHPLRWSCKHWSLLVLLSCSLGSAAGFAGSLPLVRGRVGRRVQAPHVVLAQAGEGNTRVLDALEFVIGTTFSSRLYIGSPQLHLSVPVPPPESYPEFVPTWVRLPRSVYDLVDRGVKKGWIKKAGADTIFQIKYGVLRGEVNVLPDETCEPCELEKRQRLELDAARDLVNIGEAERTRRTNAGYALAVSSLLAGYAAIDLDGGPLARFPAAVVAVAGYAFIESGKSGL